MNEKFRGTTLECLKHFAANLAKEQMGSIKNSIALFTGASYDTSHRWLKGSHPPKGQFLVKIRYFLELNGYEVIELQILHLIIREFGRFYAYGIINAEEVAKKLFYGQGQEDRAIAVLQGVRGCSKERLDIMRKIMGEKRDLFEQKQKEVLSHLSPTLISSSILSPISNKTHIETKIISEKKKEKEIEIEDSARSLILRALSDSVNMMIPLANLVLSDHFDAKERHQLRAMADNGYGIFKLANILNRLCSEKAREIIQVFDDNNKKEEK